jgi:putative lipoprotein (rSAM/lipoprotein system)
MKLSSKLIAKLFTLLGISLCCTACYGVPQTDYRLSIGGSVVAGETGEPIENISVSSEIFSDDKADIFHKITTQTNKHGGYALYEGMPFPMTLAITAEDIDGEENGGEFATQTITIELKESDFHEIDKYDMESHKTVNFELKLKSDK